jgi:hypothetical protein
VRDLNSLIGKEIRRNRYAGGFDDQATAAAFHFTIFSTYVLNEIESAVSLSTYRRRGVIRWAAQQARGSLPLMTG